MQLGIQAALGASDTSGNSPFLIRLAAERWALRWVASIMTGPVAVLSTASVAKIQSNMPPHQAAPDYMNDTADDAPIIHARHSS